jgi:hypothetical protein
MSLTNRILLFFVLPIVGLFAFPPSLLANGIIIILLVVVMLVGLGLLLLQGRSLALTFAIFLQGMNVIIRVMMFFSNSFPVDAPPNIPFLVSSLIAVIISFWLVVRLDQQDVRLKMVR